MTATAIITVERKYLFIVLSFKFFCKSRYEWYLCDYIYIKGRYIQIGKYIDN